MRCCWWCRWWVMVVVVYIKSKKKQNGAVAVYFFRWTKCQNKWLGFFKGLCYVMLIFSGTFLFFCGDHFIYKLVPENWEWQLYVSHTYYYYYCSAKSSKIGMAHARGDFLSVDGVGVGGTGIVGMCWWIWEDRCCCFVVVELVSRRLRVITYIHLYIFGH